MAPGEGGASVLVLNCSIATKFEIGEKKQQVRYLLL